MRYLLDTQILIWSLVEPHRLSAKTKEILDSPSNLLFVSSISVVEIQQKRKVGKLEFDVDILDFVDKEVFQRLHLTLEHSAFSINLPLLHRDPFDRLLIAQSIVEKMPLLTADKLIQQYDFKFVSA